MRPVRSLVLVALTVVAGAASDALTKPGTDYVAIDTEHLHVLVRRGDADALRPLIGRADAIYAHLAADAGYAIRSRLTLWLSDDTDDHNGFSTVVPRPLVNIQLAPSLPESSIFAGADELERTIVHELAHHISSDRNPNRFRRALETVFGRVLPFDPLSLVVFYLSTPAHVTMPNFWHEGLAQWAETTYAQPGAWGGRGRDARTHMVWRLDAAERAIPDVAQWRLTWPQWPFGNRVYIYGLAYTRWLEGAYGASVPFWRVVDEQSTNWALSFSSGARGVIGQSHHTLIDRARADLQAEQERQLAALRTQPITASRRQTPVDTSLGAPAWLPDGSLLAAVNGPFDRPSQRRIDAEGALHATGRTAWAMGGVRADADGTLVYAEADGTSDPWERSRVRIIPQGRGGALTLSGDRLVQPDHARGRVAAIHLAGAGRTALVVTDLVIERGLFSRDVRNGAWRELPVQGRPWSPAFRPGSDDLAWVETDAAGSRLVLAPLADPTRRTVLWSVAGRLMHPAWNRDGSRLFVCADHTGVANAWQIDPAKPGTAVPVTNVIGGVIACVPSPDGRTLAVIDHDRRGPYIARLANDPATWPASVPAISLAWPAPVPAAAGPQVAGHAAANHAPAGQARPLPADTPPATGEARTYHGVTAMRPLFWTPTLAATPDGGLGVAGFAADPLFTNEVAVGAGFGASKGTPVGFAAYTWAPYRIEAQAVAWRGERLYDGQIVSADGARHDYVEWHQGAELRLGTGLAGLSRRWQAYVGAGGERVKQVAGIEKDWNDQPLLTTPRFAGVERYVEAGIAYDDTTFFPTSYAREDGDTVGLRWRRSGLGGDLSGDRITANATRVWSIWPAMGWQVVGAGLAGWSRGDDYPQGRFAIGGAAGVGLPRGYTEVESSGRNVLAWSTAFRFSLPPRFTWFSTTPFGFRQVVGEIFYDAAQTTDDRIGGHGRWFRSAGAEVRGEWEVWLLRFAPGGGVAHLFQRNGELSPYITLDFAY